MNQTAVSEKVKTASLDALYGLIHNDLKQVDALILGRVKSEIPLIHDIARHIIASGGKRIRPVLTLDFSAALRISRGSAMTSSRPPSEFIHTATLLRMMTFVDESKLRRGLATANDVFGNKASVLVGDFLLSQAFQLMVGDGSLKALENIVGSPAR